VGIVPILYTYRYRIPQPPPAPANPDQTANFGALNRCLYGGCGARQVARHQ
jgi:hypothetical protein